MKLKSLLNVPILALVCSATSLLTSCGGALSFIGDTAKAIGSAYSAPLIENYARSAGYSEEDARKIREDAFKFVGASNSNGDLGVKYVKAEDKVSRQNAAFQFCWNISDIEGGKYGDVLSGVKKFTDPQFAYNEKRALTSNQDEIDKLKAERNAAMSNVLFSAYEEKREKQAEYLAEKLDLARQLQDKGYNPSQAIEVSGFLLALEKTDMPADEKEKYYKSFGLSQNVPEIRASIAAVNDPNYTPSSPQPTPPIDPTPNELQDTIVTEPVIIQSLSLPIVDGFALGKAMISSQMQEKLDDVVADLKSADEKYIVVVGHTCNLGSQRSNMILGRKRAEAVKAYLVSQGISADRINIESKGETEPLNSNSNKEERKANRRVEFVVE